MRFNGLLSDEPYDELVQKWDYLYERANHLVWKPNKVIVIHLRIGTEEIRADRFFWRFFEAS
jgi:adenine deaminase